MAADRRNFRRQAERQGKSLTAWIREAAREKFEAEAERTHFETPKELGAFFASCDRREREPEPDWEAHRGVIERSVRTGGAET